MKQLVTSVFFLGLPLLASAHEGHDHATTAWPNIPTWVLSIGVVLLVAGLFYGFHVIKFSISTALLTNLVVLVAIIVWASFYRPTLNIVAIALGFLLSLLTVVFGAQAEKKNH